MDLGFVTFVNTVKTKYGLRNDHVARAMNLTSGYLAHIMSGQRAPGVRTYRKAWLAFPEDRSALIDALTMAVDEEEGTGILPITTERMQSHE